MLRSLRRLSCERGIALPATMAILFAASMLSAAAVTAAIGSNRQSARDGYAKRALAAADAGVDTIMSRMNRHVNGADRCLGKNATDVIDLGPPVGTPAWCPAATPDQIAAQTEDLGDGASFSYRVSASSTAPSDTNRQRTIKSRTIVSTGTVNGVSRRVMVTVKGLSKRSWHLDNAVRARDYVKLANTAAGYESFIKGNVATEGYIEVLGSSKICGDVRTGTGGSDTIVVDAPLAAWQSLVGGACAAPSPPPPLPDEEFPDEPWADFPDLPQLPADNGRIGVAGQDPFSPSGCGGWNAGTRVLTLDLGCTLNLGKVEGAYSFCDIDTSNGGYITVTPGNRVNIYIESPDTCPYDASSNKSLYRVTIYTALQLPNTVRVWVQGSDTTATTYKVATPGASQSSNASRMSLYAPKTGVDMSHCSACLGGSTGDPKIRGAVTAQSFYAAEANPGVPTVEYDPDISNIDQNLYPIYYPRSSVECTAQPPAGATLPSDGCS